MSSDPTDRIPPVETIPVLVRTERPEPQKCSECDEALFGFHYTGRSSTFSFHLSWWTILMAISIIGVVYGLITGKS